MRMLRALFGSAGTIIVHDTLQEVGSAPAEYRPFIHSYATATLMGEGEKSNVGTNWSWARYCASQFRKSNAFGSIKGTGWTGPGISAPNVGNQDLVQLVLGGRERPGLPGYSERYLPTLRELQTVWRAHGDPKGENGNEVGSFYDQFYLPAVLDLTKAELGQYSVGRSPMPIATVLPSPGADSGHRRIQLEIFRSNASNGDALRYTTDGMEVSDQSTLYTGLPIEVEAGAVVRVRNYRLGSRPPSRELQLQVKSDDLELAPLFTISNTLGDMMVLQRAPESAVVWGFCDEPGTRIIATFRGQALPAVVPDGAGVWRVRLPPNAPTSVPTTIV